MAKKTYRFDPAVEVMPRAKLRTLQLKRLKQTVKNAWNHVPVQRKRMLQRGIKPGDIRSLDDLSLLPFTVKGDLRDHYPFGLFAQPRETLMRLHASSGTTGKPTVVGYSEKDISTWADLMARTMGALACSR